MPNTGPPTHTADGRRRQMGKPTKEEFEIAATVMEWVQEETEREEPHAVAFIDSCGEMIFTCGMYASEPE
jgi:hypothetical protein